MSTWIRVIIKYKKYPAKMPTHLGHIWEPQTKTIINHNFVWISFMFLSFRFLTSSEALLFKIGYSIKVKASTFSDLEPTSRFILASYNILPFISLLQCGPVFHGQNRTRQSMLLYELPCTIACAHKNYVRLSKVDQDSVRFYKVPQCSAIPYITGQFDEVYWGSTDTLFNF